MTPSIFSLDRYDIGCVTSIEMTDVLRVVTDPRLWAHAVEFRPRVLPGSPIGPIVVHVSLEVESGQIEVGALSETGTTFLSESTVGTGFHVVQLPIAAISRCRSVSVRNAARSASVVRIVSIGERRDHQSARPIDGIDLSAPLGSSRRGFWDKNIDADVLRLAGAGARTVFHVGAHHGGEASAYLKLFPDAWIHCFEPSPAAFRILHERLGGSDRIGTSNLLEQVRPALIVEVSAAALATCVSTPQRVFDLLNQTRYRCHTRSPGRSSFQSSRVMPSVTEISLRSRGNVRSPESCPR
jgi:hypothetical protein